MANLPYISSPGRLKSALEKIQSAATPPRFTTDFLETKLGLKGGSARQVLPFFKKIGLLHTDGSPTDLYKKFRNPSEAGRAMAEAMKIGYKPLFEANEYVHEASETKLKGLIVQLGGLEENSSVVKFIMACFKICNEYADFKSIYAEEESEAIDQVTTESVPQPQELMSEHKRGVGLNLSYTINLNLPATSDITVFNAIFKSLKENLLKG